MFCVIYTQENVILSFVFRLSYTSAFHAAPPKKKNRKKISSLEDDILFSRLKLYKFMQFIFDNAHEFAQPLIQLNFLYVYLNVHCARTSFSSRLMISLSLRVSHSFLSLSLSLLPFIFSPFPSFSLVLPHSPPFLSPFISLSYFSL